MTVKLKAKQNKGKYKNTNAWLDAVYRNNKQLIDTSLITTGRTSSKSVFKQLVKEYMEEGMSPTKAVNTLAKTTIFTPEVERLKSNAFKGLKGDKDAYKTFRKLVGWREKIDDSKMVYDASQHVYVYDNRVTVSFTNSPYGVNVGVII